MNIIKFTYGTSPERSYTHMFDLDREKQTPDAWLNKQYAYHVDKLGFKILSEEELGDSADAVAQFFEFLVNGFDFTYQYSDDHYVWKRGVAYERYMKQIGGLLPHDAMIGIYNGMIDRKYPDADQHRQYREEFYWK